MKFFGKVVLVVFAMVAASEVGYAQADSCIVDYCILHPSRPEYHETCRNRDSVLVDTCSGSATHNEMYAKKWYGIIFTYYAISLLSAPADTTLEVSWTAIDTKYTALRSSFSALETKYGRLHLRKYAPSFIDSTDLNSRIYSLRFENYFCVDSVLHDLASFPELYNYSFASYPGVALGVTAPPQKITQLLVQPNPATKKIKIKRNDNKPMSNLLFFNIIGEKVFDQNLQNSAEVEVDVNSLPNGLYIVSCGSLRAFLLVAR